MRARLAEWSPFHTLAVLWAFYLGPLVLLWAERTGYAQAYGPFLLILLVATGWLVPWWVGALCLALAATIVPVMDHHLLPFQLGLGSQGLNAGLATYAVGLVFLGLGRALRWGWDHLHRARLADDMAREERERKEQLALIFRAAAHEIANPLTPMAIHLKLLQRDASALQSENLLQGLQRMDRSVDRLTRLVAEFQDVARGLQGDFTIQPRDVELAQVLRDIATDHAELCRQSGLGWAADIPPTLQWRADPDRVGQAVTNLCQNAIRYTPPGGKVELRVSTVDRDLMIEVKDSGVGLSPADVDLIFEPFTRLERDVDRISGSGLGLWIVRRIARAHGGEVTATSDGPGKGSTFQLRIAGRARPSLLGATANAAAAPRASRAGTPVPASDQAGLNEG